MKLKKLIQFCVMCAVGAVAVPADAQQTVAGLPPMHVDGRFLKDEQGNKLVLHGVMDTPSPYFNEWRWGGSATDDNVSNCINYFNAIFDVITDNEKGAYCNLFRLHLDPAWTNGKAGSWKVDSRETGTNEADISHYESARLDKYLTSVYIPIAQKAISHKMYVIMRPPGVCPGNIYVGGSYQKYLLDVWDRVSKHRLIQKYCGQIGLELANEPVGVKLADGSDSEKALHDFFQPIVDKIRANGFKGVIWVPGKGWQGSYADYEKYPITGENIGYAVHDYDGWYGCEDKKLSAKDVKDATQRKIQQFHNQVPMVDTNPIVITEIDWSPKKPGTGHYNEHGDWVESNYGSWATGRSSVWGEITKGVHDYYGNISMTLSGTHCYIDFNDCIKISGNATKTYTLTGRATPAYKKAMEADGLDPYDGCGVACFKWYAEYAKVNYPSLARYQPVQEYPEDPFELSKEWFNPSIIRKGTAQHVASYSSLTIKKGGLAGWSFEDCIDLSAYKTLVVKMKRTPVKNTCLRIYDSGSLFGDCYQLDLGGEKEFTIPLSELKKQSGEQLDPSHIRFVGFTPLMNDINLYVEKVYLSNDETAITAVQADAADDEGYFDLMGRPMDNPTRGFYIRRSDRKKVFIP